MENSCQVGTHFERRENPAGKEIIVAMIRVPKINNYTVMSNHHLLNPALSLKAKGLMSYMLSRPDSWDFTIEGLARLNKEGADAIGRIIRELEANGYITRVLVRNKAGKFADMEYNILERPRDMTASDAENPASASPFPENPVTDATETAHPLPEDQGQRKTIESKTERENMEASNPIPSKTDPSIPPQTAYTVPTGVDGLRKRLNTAELTRCIKAQIEYDILVDQYSRDEVDNLVSLMAEILSSRCSHFTISGRQIPAELVFERFSALTFHHIAYVFDCLERSRSKIRNIKQYLLAALFNAPATFDSFYSAEVRHDFDFRSS